MRTLSKFVETKILRNLVQMFKAKKILSIVFTILALNLVFISCKKDKDQTSTTPAIEYKDFVKFSSGDSAQIVIHFVDGDGNIGNDFPSTEQCADNDFLYYNLRAYYMFKNASGNFDYLIMPRTGADTICRKFDTLQSSAIVPNIEPVGQNKYLEGDIKVTLNSPYYNPLHTIIRYRIFLFDKNGNRSNEIFTPEITVP